MKISRCSACATSSSTFNAKSCFKTRSSKLGGTGSHWNGLHWRLLPSDLSLRSHLTQRYGKTAIASEMTIQDFGVSYDELEPFYDRFEKPCDHDISGVAAGPKVHPQNRQPAGIVILGAYVFNNTLLMLTSGIGKRTIR